MCAYFKLNFKTYDSGQSILYHEVSELSVEVRPMLYSSVIFLHHIQHQTESRFHSEFKPIKVTKKIWDPLAG